MVGFPVAYYAARYARGKWKAIFYLGVMLPLWSSYLVKVYSWKLILAKEGILNWLFETLHLGWLLNAYLAIPVIGGNSLSVSCDRHVPGVSLCLAAVHDPADPGRAGTGAAFHAGGLGRSGRAPGQTFRHVLLPLALPGVIAGSIFTFSLTLGDYIIPQIVGSSRRFIGQAVYAYQGTAGNIPLAAAFAVVPILSDGGLSLDRQTAGSFRCTLTARLWA